VRPAEDALAYRSTAAGSPKRPYAMARAAAAAAAAAAILVDVIESDVILAAESRQTRGGVFHRPPSFCRNSAAILPFFYLCRPF